MATTTKNQWSITKYEQDTHLLTWIEALKAQGIAKDTLYFYQKKLNLFIDFCEAQVITQITDITPGFLRQYMLYLEDTGHSEGGRHACYRTWKTFLNWRDNLLLYSIPSI